MRLDQQTVIYKGISDAPQARARVLVRHIAAELGVPEGEIVLGRDGNGKPFLAGSTEYWFNTAGCDGLLLIGSSRRGKLGVDLETLPRCAAAWEEASRSFAPAERAALPGLPAAARPLVFARLWTAKEAVLKARGVGIVAGLAQPDLSCLPDFGGLPPWAPNFLNLDGEKYLVTWYMLTIDEVEVVVARAEISPNPGTT